MLRIRPEVHAAATIAAQSAGKSLNQWADEVSSVLRTRDARQQKARTGGLSVDRAKSFWLTARCLADVTKA
jgi:hypothetical protein